MPKKIPAANGARINNKIWRPTGVPKKSDQVPADMADLNPAKGEVLGKKIKNVIKSKMNSTKVAQESKAIANQLAKLQNKSSAGSPKAGIQGQLVISVPNKVQLQANLDSKLGPAMALEAMHSQWGIIRGLLQSELLIWSQSIQQILSERLEKSLYELAYIDPVVFEVVTGQNAGQVIERASSMTKYKRTGTLASGFENLLDLHQEGNGISLVVDIGRLQSTAPYWIYLDQGHTIQMFVPGSGLEEVLMPARNFMERALQDLHEYLNLVLIPQIMKLYQGALDYVGTWITTMDSSGKVVSLAPNKITGPHTGFSTRLGVGR